MRSGDGDVGLEEKQIDAEIFVNDVLKTGQSGQSGNRTRKGDGGPGGIERGAKEGQAETDEAERSIVLHWGERRENLHYGAGAEMPSREHCQSQHDNRSAGSFYELTTQLAIYWSRFVAHNTQNFSPRRHDLPEAQRVAASDRESLTTPHRLALTIVQHKDADSQISPRVHRYYRKVKRKR